MLSYVYMPKCDICDIKLFKINLNLNVYSHFLFKQIHKNKNIYYYQCDNCKLIYNKKFFLNKIFKSKSYILSNQTKQKQINFKNKNISRAELQSKKFYNYISNKKNPSILDIGSFDGLLLKEFKKKLVNKKYYKLYGYDINNSLKNSYDKQIIFYTNFQKLFQNKYDLIILSHSIMYINHLRKVISLIKNNLKTDGTFIIQFSNLNNRPMNILLADQYIFPSEYSINFIFKKSGYNSKILNSEYFKNESILIFKKKFINKNSIYKILSLKNLIEFNKKCFSDFLKKISKYNKFYIFGTTLEASVVYDILYKNKKITLGFIDENSTSKKFRSLNIFHSDNILKNYCIIFPYNNFQLKKRLEKKFLNKFISIY